MLSELAGFTVTRTIPDNVMMGVMSGAYKVYGGVIRNNAGQIVAHLANTAAGPLNPVNFLNAALTGVNTYQLSRIGTNVAQLLSLATGTMLLSGLTLGVSAIGFILLNKKLDAINKRLDDIKGIQKILSLKEKGELLTALQNLGIVEDPQAKKNIIEATLVQSKKTISDIHNVYSIKLGEVKTVQEAFAVEEFFTLTAICHARIAAEQERFDHAHGELIKAYDLWHEKSKRILNDQIIKNEPAKFMRARYKDSLRIDEMIDCLDFAIEEKGIAWIDDFRSKEALLKVTSKFGEKLKNREKIELEFMRKVASRDKILKGYVSQYKYYADIKQKPSTVQKFIKGISKGYGENDNIILLSNDFMQVA